MALESKKVMIVEDEDEVRAKELGAERFFTKSKTTLKSIVEEMENFLD